MFQHLQVLLRNLVLIHFQRDEFSYEN
jgi:hypothetical protein